MLELDPDSVEVGKVTGAHLKAALKSTPASVSTDEVRRYEAFTSKFRARNGAIGSGSVSSMRTASRASTVAAGAGAGVGAGAGAAQRAAAMPDGLYYAPLASRRRPHVVLCWAQLRLVACSQRSRTRSPGCLGSMEVRAVWCAEG